MTPEADARLLNELLPSELQQRLGPIEPNAQEARKLFAAIHARPPQLPLGQLIGVRRAVCEQAREVPYGRLQVVERRRADDGFVKYLFASPLGGEFEAVRIPIFEQKHVVCISSQVGCALGCAFCHTGDMGFRRNLRAWEIVEQVRLIRDEAELPVLNLVFMGMGEPLLNYDEVVRAARVFSEPGGMQISGRNITVSTAGIVPAIERFTREGHPFRLVFSVTSAIADKRRMLMPIESRYPLPRLVEAIGAYAASRRERAMIAYVAIRGLNTGTEDAEALQRAFKDVPIKLDLIDVADPLGRYLPPTDEELARFRDALQILRSPIARRYSGGKDIGAACGTLAATRKGGRVMGEGT